MTTSAYGPTSPFRRRLPAVLLIGAFMLALAAGFARGPYLVKREAQCRDRQQLAFNGLEELIVAERRWHDEHGRYADARELAFAPVDGLDDGRPGAPRPLLLYRFVVFAHASGYLGLAYGTGEMDGDVWLASERGPPRRLASACVR